MKEGSIFDQWLPKMTGHFSADGFAALEEIKEFIRSNVSTAALEERAFLLAGLPPTKVNDGFAAFCCELAHGVAQAGMPENLRTGVVIAAADIVRERPAEIVSHGAGAHESGLQFRSSILLAALPRTC
jgi:hypothetical protein